MEQRIIQAAIVNHERTGVVIKEDGSLPQMVFIPEHDSHEGTLDEIGREVFTNVAYVSPDYKHSHEGVLQYQTKPVPESAELSAGYVWCEAPAGSEADEALTIARAYAIANADWKAGLADVLPVTRPH